MERNKFCTFLLAALAAPVWTLNAQQLTGYPTRSDTTNLAEKRYVAAGDRAYVVGTQDGSFPGMGFHIKGEMNGVWSHPLKLLDSYLFQINNQTLGPATKFTSGPGFVRLDYPANNGLSIRRTEFAPNGLPVVLIGLEIRNTGGQPANVPFTFQPTSQILPAYPWTGTTPTSDQLDQKDNVSFDPLISGLIFSEPGKPWYALVAGRATQTGPQDTVRFVGADLSSNTPDLGKKASGRLNWQVTVAAGSTVKIWLAVAGTHITPFEAYLALGFGLQNPDALLDAKIENRLAYRALSAANIPDPTVQAAFEWAKFNLADMRRVVFQAQIRDTAGGTPTPGTAYPDPIATVFSLSGFGAGYPDYPWFFGTDGAYTTFPLVAVGQWEAAEDHLRTIREVSRIVNGSTGKVLHEIVTDGSIYYGTTHEYGDTNETPEFATAVATVWRWSGDNAFRDENYQFIVDGLHYITSSNGLDTNQDGWPEGAGMVEAPNLGAEKLDVAVYTIRALDDLAEMAQSKGDAATLNWATTESSTLKAKFDPDWWDASQGLFADSLCFNQVLPTDPTAATCPQPEMQLEQLYWTNATPMETDIALPERAAAALPTLESPIFTGTTGYYQEGQDPAAGIQGSRQASALNTSVMAVAEANYGRTDESLRYVTFIASELDTEQPGALPELFDSPDYQYFQDFTSRAMVMQAWSSYGVEWPVVYHFMGVRPDLPKGEISVVPQLPSSWSHLAINNIRVGNSSLSARVNRSANEYRIEANSPAGVTLVLGYALPANSVIKNVTLNGQSAAYQVVDNHRGRQVTVSLNSGGSARVVISTQ
jgi:glycogen debranching enzyme